MKIIRTLHNSQPVYAAETSVGYVLCKGDPFAGLVPTGKQINPVHLLPPITPTTIFAIGLNYRKHATEMRQPIPEHPVVTMKNPASVIAPGTAIELPRHLPSDSVDFECELAIVIGRAVKNATHTNALDCVAGFTAANDVSARDWQKIYSGGQWCKGKGFDTFCPLGPVLVTPESIGDPDNLAISTHLNGETMQSSNTSDMIFSVRDLIVFLSGSTTLLPGTVILTGTPEGVGTARTPPRYLLPGDRVTVEIEGIGALTNPVVEEDLA